MKVGCDLDNVLVGIVDAARDVMARDHGIAPADIRYTGIYWDPFTHDDERIATRIRPSMAFWDREDVLSSSKPLDGAHEAAWRLYDAGLLTCYITRRPDHVSDITAEWIATHGFPPVPIEHVGSIAGQDYYERCKSTVCLRYGVTHMIDDSAGEAEMLKRAGINVILVDAPIGRDERNAFLEKHPAFPLARDAAHAADLLMKIRKEAA